MYGNPNAPLRSARVTDHPFNADLLKERATQAEERIKASGYKRVTLDGGVKALIAV